MRVETDSCGKQRCGEGWTRKKSCGSAGRFCGSSAWGHTAERDNQLDDRQGHEECSSGSRVVLDGKVEETDGCSPLAPWLTAAAAHPRDDHLLRLRLMTTRLAFGAPLLSGARSSHFFLHHLALSLLSIFSLFSCLSSLFPLSVSLSRVLSLSRSLFLVLSVSLARALSLPVAPPSRSHCSLPFFLLGVCKQLLSACLSLFRYVQRARVLYYTPAYLSSLLTYAPLSAHRDAHIHTGSAQFFFLFVFVRPILTQLT